MARSAGRERRDGEMSIKGFVELHDYYTHAPFIVNVNAIESVSDKFIIYAQSGHNVDEHYDEIIKLMEVAQAGEDGQNA
jgi:predicted DNA-binding ArsR family transcriptional regulator